MVSLAFVPAGNVARCQEAREALASRKKILTKREWCPEAMFPFCLTAVMRKARNTYLTVMTPTAVAVTKYPQHSAVNGKTPRR